ncbi:S1 family peptidase, partial [Streptomyces tendae]
MSHKRIPKRRAAMAAGGVVALGAAAILLPNANASQERFSSERTTHSPGLSVTSGRMRPRAST